MKNNCGVQEVVFHALSQSNLQSVLNTMRKEIRHERSEKNQIYFDITGGESLILVAFGMLSKEFETPMHMYDIVDDKLIELDETTKSSISRNVDIRKIPLTLDLLIKMHGGKINSNLHKNYKDVNNNEFMSDVTKIYNIAKQNWDYWNPFADLLRNTLVPLESYTLLVCKTTRDIANTLASSNTKLRTISKLNELIDALSDEDILLDENRSNGLFQFRFKNQEIMNCLWEGGSILELYAYRMESKKTDECRVGVHLDWDGLVIIQTYILNNYSYNAFWGFPPTQSLYSLPRTALPGLPQGLYLHLRSVNREAVSSP